MKTSTKPAEAARVVAQMYKICQIDRFGEIDGVEFDFRSERLPPNEWQTIPLRAYLGHIRAPGEPFFWFPWFGRFEKGRIRKETAALLKKSGIKLSKAELECRVLERMPHVIVNHGDRIFIERVDSEGVEQFEHPHDVEVRIARLSIQRKNGQVEPIAVPLKFTGVLALIGTSAGRAAFETVRDRILARFKLGAIYDDIAGSEKPAFALEALRLARFLDEQTQDTRELAQGIPILSDGSPDRFKERRAAMATMELVNAAVKLGYLWAKTEADSEMKPKANSALRSETGAARGGAKSGKTRRLKRAETWEPIAKEMAIAIRTEGPSISGDKLASEIELRWKSREHKEPGHATLKGLISQMEKSGELPRRRPVPSIKGLRLVK